MESGRSQDSFREIWPGFFSGDPVGSLKTTPVCVGFRRGWVDFRPETHTHQRRLVGRDVTATWNPTGLWFLSLFFRCTVDSWPDLSNPRRCAWVSGRKSMHPRLKPTHTGVGLRDSTGSPEKNPGRISQKESRDRPNFMSPSLSEGRRSSGGWGRGWMTGRSAVQFSYVAGRSRLTGSAFIDCSFVLNLKGIFVLWRMPRQFVKVSL
jgi:hypothetical protein